MNQPEQDRFEELLSRLLDGNLSDEEQEQLDRRLRTDPDARALYHDHVAIHALLRWQESVPLDETQDVGLPENHGVLRRKAESRSPRRRFAALATTAVAILAGMIIWTFLGRHVGRLGRTPVAVKVLEAQDAAPGDWSAGVFCALNRLNLQSGTLRLRIEDSGVVLGVSGPVELQLVDSMLVRVARGQVTADVGEHGKGFSVETAQGRFVDLGTTFGIDAGTQGTTDLIVFKGSVQVYSDPRRTAPLSTLTEGEAVRVGSDKSLARIPNIVSGPAPGPWSTQPPAPERCVIASVRDNLRSPHDRVFYQIIPGGFKENTQAYVGPRRLWKGRTSRGLPPYLLGADVVRTFPTDQDRKGLQITVRLSRPAMLYVLFETRPQQWQWREAHNIPEVPAWLEENFHKIGDAVGLDDAGQLKPGETMSLKPGDGHLVTFDVWERKVLEPGELTLGPPTGPEGWKNWMYGILAKPLESLAGVGRAEGVDAKPPALETRLAREDYTMTNQRSDTGSRSDAERAQALRAAWPFFAGMVGLTFVGALASAAEPENLAPKAKVWASSEFSADYAARNAVDGQVPGVAPVAPDGSFVVELPADRLFHIQVLDADGYVVGNELNWHYVRPGETKGCVGCHEKPDSGPAALPGAPLALRAPPVRCLPVGGEMLYRAKNWIKQFDDENEERKRTVNAINVMGRL